MFKQEIGGAMIVRNEESAARRHVRLRPSAHIRTNITTCILVHFFLVSWMFLEAFPNSFLKAVPAV